MSRTPLRAAEERATSVSEALYSFVTQLEADGRSPHTVAQARRHVELLAGWLRAAGQDDDLQGLGHQNLAEFLRSDHVRLAAGGHPRKPSSANAIRSTMRTFFGYLSRSGMIGSDPSKFLRRAICSEPPPRSLTPGEEAKLVEVLRRDATGTSARDRALILTMLWGGVRVGSAVSLRRQDVDLEAGELLLEHSKGGRRERVVLGEQLVLVLRGYIIGAGIEDGFLFPGPTGNPLSTRHVQRILADQLQRAGIERRLSPHSLRHTLATRLYERTRDPFLVKEALRHRSLTSTMRYVSVERATLRAAMP